MSGGCEASYASMGTAFVQPHQLCQLFCRQMSLSICIKLFSVDYCIAIVSTDVAREEMDDKAFRDKIGCIVRRQSSLGPPQSVSGSLGDHELAYLLKRSD